MLREGGEANAELALAQSQGEQEELSVMAQLMLYVEEHQHLAGSALHADAPTSRDEEGLMLELAMRLSRHAAGLRLESEHVETGGASASHEPFVPMVASAQPHPGWWCVRCGGHNAPSSSRCAVRHCRSPAPPPAPEP